MSSITMKDVARKAGVSLGTVSNVINDAAGVKEVNREKVRQAMKELGYIPNLAAQSFRTSRSKTLGLVIPTITNPYYPAIAQGVADTATRNGYQTIICHSERSHDADLKNLETLISNRVAGIILIKTLLTVEEINRFAQHAPFVLVDQQADCTVKFDLIMTNNHQGVVDAVDALYELGHRQIAYLAGDLKFLSSVERLDSYLHAMTRHRLTPIGDQDTSGTFSWEYGQKRAMELLNAPEPPTAIICANDLLAMGVYKAADRLNMSIPADLSVIGCDDIDLCQFVKPELTTIYQPKYEQGELAVKIILERLAGKRVWSPRTYLLPTHLVFRRSTTRVIP